MRLKSRSVWAAVIWSLDWGLRICFTSHMICSVIWSAGWLLLLVVAWVRISVGHSVKLPTWVSLQHVTWLQYVSSAKRKRAGKKLPVLWLTRGSQRTWLLPFSVCWKRVTKSSPHSQRILTFFKITKLCMTNSWISSYFEMIICFLLSFNMLI